MEHMEHYFGFDLGDAESAVAHIGKGEAEPEIIQVCGAGSFITAYARLAGGELLIGESACYSSDACVRKIRFKSSFLNDRDSAGDIRVFASGVLDELVRNGDVRQGEGCCFYIGCPAGWDMASREKYRKIFEEIGYPPVRIVSESRAALISACQSPYLQIGYDILSKSVLVVDAGSSTTDFAFIESGREVELQTAGEVRLGGGVMDMMLLDECVEESPDRERIEDVFRQSQAWRNYCEFAARKLKEKYFVDEDYWLSHKCGRSIEIFYNGTLRLNLRIDSDMVHRLLCTPSAVLNGKSFSGAFKDSLSEIKGKISAHGNRKRGESSAAGVRHTKDSSLSKEYIEEPELIFLTGGVSNMPSVREWCQEAFPGAVVITAHNPEFSVARGLSYCGRIDEEMKAFRREVGDLIESNIVERIVSGYMEDLYRRLVETLVDPILETPVMSIFDRWRKADIKRLSEIDEILKEQTGLYLRGDEASGLLAAVISSWLKPVAYALEEYTMPICVRHNIPYRAMNLTSYLTLSDIDIKIDTKNIFALDQVTWMIDAIISILVGLLCGGGGIALIAGGLKGILAGAFLSLSVLMIGQEHFESRIMNINIPAPLRRLVTRKAFAARVRRIAPEVKAGFYSSLEKEKNDSITERLTDEISSQIEHCLSKMAEVVEVPLV